MIGRNVPLQDVHPLPATFFTHHLPNPFRYRTPQHFMAVLGDPHDMEVDGEDRMRAMAIVIHEATRSKKGCSSFRLKAGVLPFPIGDNKLLNV